MSLKEESFPPKALSESSQWGFSQSRNSTSSTLIEAHSSTLRGSDISSSTTCNPSRASFQRLADLECTHHPFRWEMGVVSGCGAGPRAGRRSLTVIRAERSVDERGRSVEEDAEVEGGQVVSLHTMVLDGHVPVVVGPCVHVPAAMGCVQHVCEARLL